MLRYSRYASALPCLAEQSALPLGDGLRAPRRLARVAAWTVCTAPYRLGPSTSLFGHRKTRRRAAVARTGVGARLKGRPACSRRRRMERRRAPAGPAAAAAPRTPTSGVQGGIRPAGICERHAPATLCVALKMLAASTAGARQPAAAPHARERSTGLHDCALGRKTMSCPPRPRLSLPVLATTPFQACACSRVHQGR